MENVDEFSLKWNYFQSSLSTGFHDLLKEEVMVDVTLAAEGKILHAHKIILSVCSPYFRDIFKVNPCQHPIVILKDVGHQEMADMLDFMYRGEANVRGEDLAAFLKLADTLKIKGLVEENSDNEDVPLSPPLKPPKKSSAGRVPKKKKVIKTPEIESDDTDHNSGGGEPRRKKRRATSPAKTESAMSFPNIMNVQSFPLADSNQEMPDPLISINGETREHLEQLIPVQENKQEQDFYNCNFDTFVEDPGSGSHEMDSGVNPCISNPKQLSQVEEPFNYSFTLTQKGRPKLHHLGYEYTSINSKKPGPETYWRCTKYNKTSCKARAILGDTGLTITGNHNHKPSFHQSTGYSFDE